jgi:hypothetical protein
VLGLWFWDRKFFLQRQPDPKRLYDRVVMNPSFYLERDVDHLTHEHGGRSSKRPLFALTKPRNAVAFFVSRNSLPADMIATSCPSGKNFSGTNVNTIVLQLWNNGRGTHW